MSFTGTSKPVDLARVRRFEAAGFRAWPASSVHFDGAWAVRLTAGHPAKRLNSVNPLDPGDHGNLEERIAQAARLFQSYGRPLTFRMSPLSGEKVPGHLDALGWPHLGESLVMAAELDDGALRAAVPQIPLRDLGRFIDAAIGIRNLDPSLRRGLSEVIGSIQPEVGLFVLEQDGAPMSTAICVRDGQLAGLFEVATDTAERGKGYGRRTILSALHWARTRGATIGWLQVEADNEPAIGLYRSMGFEEIYRYVYRQPSEAMP